MKKVICIIIGLLLVLSSVAIAEVDLASMSFDDLIALQKQLVAEIMSRPEWKEVTVPTGSWKIGDEIPAGTYSISTASIMASIQIWSQEPNSDYNGFIDIKTCGKDNPIGKIEFKEGQYIEISTSVIFAPPVSLGF